MSPHGSWAGTDGHKATTARSLPTVPCSHPASRPPGAGQGPSSPANGSWGRFAPALSQPWALCGSPRRCPLLPKAFGCAGGSSQSGWHEAPRCPGTRARRRLLGHESGGFIYLGMGGGGHFLKPFVAHFLIPASPRRTHTRFRGRSCPDCDQHPKCCILNFCTLGPAGCHSPMRLRRDSGWPPGSFRFLPSPSRY